MTLGYFSIDGLEISSMIFKGSFETSSPTKSSSETSPIQDKTNTEAFYEGQEPMTVAFTLKSTSQTDFQAAIAAIENAPEGSEVFIGSDDSFGYLVTGSVSKTNPTYTGTTTGLWRASVELVMRDAFLRYGTPEEYSSSTYGEWQDVENSGDIECPVLDYYSVVCGATRLASPNLVIGRTDHSTLIAEILLATSMNTYEEIEVDFLSQKIYQWYQDDFSDGGTRYAIDKANGVSDTYSGGSIVLTNAWVAYYFAGPHPIKSFALTATLSYTGTAANAVIWWQYVDDGGWYEVEPIQNGIKYTYYIDCEGKSNIWIIFQSTDAGTTLTVQDFEVLVERELSDEYVIMSNPGDSYGISFLEAGAHHAFDAYGKLYPKRWA